jgi:hypothetical protein
MKKYSPYIPYALYLFIAVLIMLPVLRGGYLFFLDMVWGPQIQLSDLLNNGVQAHFPIMLVLKLISLAVGSALTQKLLLIFVLFSIGSGMYVFARRYMTYSWAFVAGLLYLANPFVYERFLAGQWLVLSGYAFFPIVMDSFYSFLHSGSRKKLYKFILLFSIYPIISLHWTYISFFVLFLTLIVHLHRRRRLKKLPSKETWKLVGSAALFFLIINSFWLFGFWGHGTTMQAIGLNDFRAYATESDARFGPFFNVVSLYGFWNNAYFLPKDFFAYWWLVSIAIFILFLAGLNRLLDQNKKIGWVIGIIFIPAVLLSMGYVSKITEIIVNIFYYILPGFKGLRETAKLVGLLAFMYALTVPIGASFIFKRWQRSAQVFVITLILLFSFGMFHGFNGQFKAYDYPFGWQEVNKMMLENKDSQAMIFPWHGYTRLKFANNTLVANPARAFFSVPVVTGNNLDNVFFLGQDNDIFSQLVLKWKQGENIADSLDLLHEKNITHFVLLKEGDYEQYSFIDGSSNWLLEKKYEDADIALFEVAPRDDKDLEK